jgi:hypothetical protein
MRRRNQNVPMNIFVELTAMKTSKVVSLLVAIVLSVLFMPRADAACSNFQMDQEIQARWQQQFAGAIGCPVANQGPTQDGRGVQVPFQYGWIIKPNNHYMGSNFLLIAQFFPNYNPNPNQSLVGIKRTVQLR